MAVRTAVLASGGGTNLQAILDFNSARGELAASRIVLVASNRPDAGALDRARNASVAAEVFDARDNGTSLIALLERHSIELVVLAGYLKRIPSPVISALKGRMINIHPGILPDFGGSGMYGAKVHAAVIASGARSSGVTAHFVEEDLDTGPVIAQWRVPVLAGDTPESLGARVLEVEHIVYPRVVDLVASLEGGGFFADF